MHLNWVSPDYFATMSTPIRIGPRLHLAGHAGQPESGDRQPDGWHANTSGTKARSEGESRMDDVTYEIVAVAGDAKYLEIRDVVPPSMYFSAFQQCRPSRASSPSARPAGRWRHRRGRARRPARRRPVDRRHERPVPSPSRSTRPSWASACWARCREFSPRSGCCSLSVGLYGVMSYRSRGGRARSASAWRSARSRPGSAAWSFARRSC